MSSKESQVDPLRLYAMLQDSSVFKLVHYETNLIQDLYDV